MPNPSPKEVIFIGVIILPTFEIWENDILSQIWKEKTFSLTWHSFLRMLFIDIRLTKLC